MPCPIADRLVGGRLQHKDLFREALSRRFRSRAYDNEKIGIHNFVPNFLEERSLVGPAITLSGASRCETGHGCDETEAIAALLLTCIGRIIAAARKTRQPVVRAQACPRAMQSRALSSRASRALRCCSPRRATTRCPVLQARRSRRDGPACASQASCRR